MLGWGLIPDLRCYEALIDAHSLHGNGGAAVGVLARAEAAGLAPTAETYRRLLHGLGAAGDLQRAAEVRRFARGAAARGRARSCAALPLAARPLGTRARMLAAAHAGGPDHSPTRRAAVAPARSVLARHTPPPRSRNPRRRCTLACARWACHRTAASSAACSAWCATMRSWCALRRGARRRRCPAATREWLVVWGLGRGGRRVRVWMGVEQHGTYSTTTPTPSRAKSAWLGPTTERRALPRLPAPPPPAAPAAAPRRPSARRGWQRRTCACCRGRATWSPPACGTTRSLSATC